MTVTIEEAKKNLDGLIAKAAQGEPVVITSDEKPVARLIAEKQTAMQPRVPGSAKGMIAYMADDFDAPLEDFKEYMQ